MADRFRELRRFLLACRRVLACMVHIQVVRSLRCKQFWIDCRVRMFDVHPKPACRYWWPGWSRVHGHNTSCFQHNLSVCHRMYLVSPLMIPSYIFHKCIRFQDNIVHFVCMQHFLSSNQHTRTCGNICLHLDMVCVHCILVSNIQGRSSFSHSPSFHLLVSPFHEHWLLLLILLRKLGHKMLLKGAKFWQNP